MTLIPWKDKTTDPFKDFLGSDDVFKKLTLFPTLNRSIAEFGNLWYPAIDVSEDEKNVYVRVDLPGVSKDDIDVSIEDDVLTIKGERKIEEEKKGKKYHIIERGYGSFQRMVQLGVIVDQENIKAKYNHGILEIVLIKVEKEKGKKINIELN
jgi:HSP20 family protein